KGRLGAASTKPHTRMDLDIRGYDFQLPPLHPIIKGIAPITIVTGVTDFDIDIALTRKGLKGMLDFDISDLEILSAAKKGSKEEKEFTRLQHLVDLIEGPGGVVQLDVPFEGTPDDLKWSFDSIISKAIGKILRKTVFAPFGLFEDIVGLTKGKWNPDIPPTEFAQSSAKIEPDELRDINTLAKALKKRPNLAIALRGSATRQDFTMPASDEQRLEWGEIRVQEVVKHLRRAGLAKHRIQIKDAIISDSAQVDYELVSSKGMVDKMDPTALKIKKKRIEFLIEND
ncbi:MAG: hypothetical protein JKX97_03475, partial [Candidatus Lindowbacteria bacterium]|nr:hypothetical protein [Candidatus Lindowbacteria bacterium]